MKKRVLGILLALMMVLSLVPSTAFATEIVASGKCGDNLTWTLDDTGELTIRGTGAMDSCYDGSAPWCSKRSLIKTVKISNSVTSIGAYAFYGCCNLTNVTIPNSVTNIGGGAFEFCYSLMNIVIPDSVTHIGDSAFYSCSSLTNVAIPGSVTGIRADVFAKCDSLENVTIGDGVIYIDEGAFSSCSSLTNVTIPSSVTSIWNCAFSGCGLTSVIIPYRVKSIREQAFANCGDLTDVTFWGNAPTIGDEAFYAVTARVQYPTENTTWTDKVKKDYGGQLTWLGIGHQHTLEPIQAVSATCSTYGLTEGSRCTICGKVITKQEVVPTTDKHSYVDTIKKPTHTAKGYTLHQCSVCGDSYKDTYTAMKKLARVKITSIENAKDGITMKWGKVDGATDYQVWRKVGTDKWQLIKTTTSTSLTNTGLTNGSKYQYKVCAVAKVGGKVVNTGEDSVIKTMYRLTQPTLADGTKNIATKKIVVKWNKNTKASGYQIKYVKGSTTKTVKVKGAATLSKTLSSLTKGSTYKVSVRSYKTVSGTTYYSAYSAVKSVKVSK